MVEKMPYKVVRVDDSWWGHLNYPVEKSEEIETKSTSSTSTNKLSNDFIELLEKPEKPEKPKKYKWNSYTLPRRRNS